MVGVPRSKGCRNCVQSRVKCDQTRPSCLRCQKRAISCPGYGPNLKFQDEGPRLQQHYKKKAQSSTPERRLASDDGSELGTLQLANGMVELEDFMLSMEDPQACLSSADAFNPLADDTTESSRLSAEPGSSFPPSSFSSDLSLRQTHIPLLDIVNSPQLMQTQLLSWYINSTTYTNQRIPGPKYQLEWLKECLNYHRSSVLLSLAVRACALSHLGRLYESEQLVCASGSFYQSALRYLARTLGDDRDNGREAKSSITLAATLFLSIYEMYTCTTSHSWVKHAGGAGALMRVRGPRAHRTGFDKAMYLACRNILIVEAFESDTPCFLDEPEWRALDQELSAEFANTSPLILPMERFYAECVCVPRLCSDSRIALNHNAGGEEFAKALRDLMCRALTHRANLVRMLSRFEMTLKSTSQWMTTVPNPNPEESAFPEVYDFSDIFIAIVVGTSRVTLCVIILEMLNISTQYRQTFGDSILDKIVQPARLSTAAGNGSFDLPALTSREMIYQELQDHARKGCMAVPWLARSNFIGPFYATFALRLARRALESEAETLWIRTKMKEIGKKMGIAGVGVTEAIDLQAHPGYARRMDFDESGS